MEHSDLDALLRSMDDAPCLMRSFERAANYQLARDWYTAHGCPSEADRMQWELEAWSLIPSTVHSGVRHTDYLPRLGSDEGRQWPDIGDFSEEQWDYLRSRCDSSNNMHLVAHYGDILWLFKKDYPRARRAIDAFDAFELQMWSEFEQDPEYLLGPQWITALFRPLEIAKQLSRKDDLERTRQRVLERIDALSRLSNCNGTTASVFAGAVIRFDLLGPVEREAIRERLDDFYSRLSDDDLFREQLLKIKLDIARKGADSEVIQNAVVDIGEYYIARANIREPESKILAASALEDAAYYYEQLPRNKYESKLDELQRRRIDLLSDDSQYSSIVREIATDSSHVESFLKTCRNEGIPDVLIPAMFFFLNAPSCESLSVHLAQLRKEAPLSYLLRHVPVSMDGVVEFVPESEEEKDTYHKWSYATEYIRLLSGHLLQLTQLLGSAWSLDGVERILDQDTLIDQSRKRNLTGAFRYYFNGDLHVAVTLFTLEIEPLLRGVLYQLGLATTVSNPKNGQGAQKVKNLDDCLRTPEISQQLGESWVVTANALLTKDGGEKLRHRVAHGRDIDNLVAPSMALTLASMILWIATFGTEAESGMESSMDDTERSSDA